MVSTKKFSFGRTAKRTEILAKALKIMQEGRKESENLCNCELNYTRSAHVLYNANDCKNLSTFMF